MTALGPEHVKVHFRLDIEDDWPPAGVESLWAIDRGNGKVELVNTPFFIRGVAIGDVVETSLDDEGVRWAGRVVQPSDNCTIRLIVFRDSGSAAARQSVLNAFHKLGAGGEGIEQFRMVALDIPPEANLAKIKRLLQHGVDQEWWDMEEGCITDAWRATGAG
ncbi:DUF4265 domain-containing protein [Streptomyces sp. MI02-7b]|uniref:DUF4265 domain-containing protein n=1 Tax=Streptomyces sp. MI02-7b TaxID=462941 RepID=UPI0029B49068|nr:DUF4265 domain-containing protein [Streptomyces sp. MI02-7b]MDX3076727.1 DUF4265 domain-containing protein [Streptomyces sp. MI02-7b]